MGESVHAQTRISVFLAEATRVNCQLMEQALRRKRSRFVVEAYAGPSTELLEKLSEHVADVVVISTNLADGPLAGFSVLRAMRVINPDTPVVMLIDSPTRELVIEAFRFGARGLFRREASFPALCKCIHAVHGGQIWANSEELHFLQDALMEAVPPRVVNSKGVLLLSRREGTIVWLVADGLTNREIAENLHLSDHTVRNYLFRIFNKLGISSRVELTLYVLNQRKMTPEQNALSV